MLTLTHLEKTSNFSPIFYKGKLIGHYWLEDDGEINVESTITGMSWAMYDSIDEAIEHIIDVYKESL